MRQVGRRGVEELEMIHGGGMKKHKGEYHERKMYIRRCVGLVFFRVRTGNKVIIIMK